MNQKNGNGGVEDARCADEDMSVQEFMDRHGINLNVSVYDRIAAVFESVGYTVMRVERNRLWRMIFFSPTAFADEGSILMKRFTGLLHDADVHATRLVLKTEDCMADLRFAAEGGSMYRGVWFYSSRSGPLQRERRETFSGD